VDQERDANGTTPLAAASGAGRTDVIRLLFRTARPATDTTDNKGWTALHHACARGFAQCAAILIARGADPTAHAKDEDGTTPVHLAAQSGNIATVEAVLSRKSSSKDTAAASATATKDGKKTGGSAGPAGSPLSTPRELELKRLTDKQGRVPRTVAEAEGHAEAAVLLSEDTLHAAAERADAAAVRKMLAERSVIGSCCFFFFFFFCCVFFLFFK
jgi:ankyrin repeat protein